MPSYTGDRIYVMKDGVSLPFFERAGKVKLERWNIAVFKLPEEPEVRYIKRLVGMPNEVIRIDGGDLWVRPLDKPDSFQRLHRTLDHQQAMQLPVYDDAHCAAALENDPRWRRWTPATGDDDDWAQPVSGSYSPSGQKPDWTELRYHHIVPSPAQWQAVLAGRCGESPRCVAHHRLLLVQHGCLGPRSLAREQPCVVSAALGRRPDTLPAPHLP